MEPEQIEMEFSTSSLAAEASYNRRRDGTEMDDLDPRHRILDEALGAIGRGLAQLVATHDLVVFDGPAGSHVLGHPYVGFQTLGAVRAQTEVINLGAAIERERKALAEMAERFLTELGDSLDGATQLAWGSRPQLMREYDPATGDLFLRLFCRLVAWKDQH